MRFFYFLNGEKGGEGRGMGEVEASGNIKPMENWGAVLPINKMDPNFEKTDPKQTHFLWKN